MLGYGPLSQHQQQGVHIIHKAGIVGAFGTYQGQNGFHFFRTCGGAGNVPQVGIISLKLGEEITLIPEQLLHCQGRRVAVTGNKFNLFGAPLQPCRIKQIL